MKTRKLLVLLLFGLIGLVSLFGCGKDEVVADPYDTLAVDNVWKNLNIITVDGQEIRITTTLNFTQAKTYSRRVQGISGSDILDSYAEEESGNYVATETEITFTPTGGSAYTVTWQKIAGTGDLELTYANGDQMLFTYEPYQGNEY